MLPLPPAYLDLDPHTYTPKGLGLRAYEPAGRARSVPFALEGEGVRAEGVFAGRLPLCAMDGVPDERWRVMPLALSRYQGMVRLAPTA